MTDKELLELAAKASGIPGRYIRIDDGHNPIEVGIGDLIDGWWWNPLTNDGDALRLAICLNLLILISPDSTEVSVEVEVNDYTEIVIKVDHKDSGPYAATRRAIVMAAAEIAKANGEDNA